MDLSKGFPIIMNICSYVKVGHRCIYEQVFIERSKPKVYHEQLFISKSAGGCKE